MMDKKSFAKMMLEKMMMNKEEQDEPSDSECEMDDEECDMPMKSLKKVMKKKAPKKNMKGAVLDIIIASKKGK